MTNVRSWWGAFNIKVEIMVIVMREVYRKVVFFAKKSAPYRINLQRGA